MQGAYQNKHHLLPKSAVSVILFIAVAIIGHNKEMINDDGIIICTQKCCSLATLFDRTFQRSVWFESERNYIMQPTITTYQYSYITQQVNQLISAELAVNDLQIRAVVRAQAIERITPLLPSDNPITANFLSHLQTDRLTRAKAPQLLETLIPLIIPFPSLTTKQLSKLFRKVKKLKQPVWSQLALHELTYLGWNDGGNQKKYLVIPDHDRLIGIQGDLAPQTVKGVCAICQTIGNVALFMSTTKSSGLGPYTRNGNYICRDSNQCNRQLTNPQALADFLAVVRPKR